ncbi:MAG: BrnT family toxin [Dongiaceae bacterium]
MIEFEWDNAKNTMNRSKHGISFEEAATIWDGPIVTGQDEAHHSEVREISFGLIGGTTVACVVHTERNGKIRIISARKATNGERREFDAYLKKARS